MGEEDEIFVSISYSHQHVKGLVSHSVLGYVAEGLSFFSKDIDSRFSLREK